MGLQPASATVAGLPLSLGWLDSVAADGFWMLVVEKEHFFKLPANAVGRPLEQSPIQVRHGGSDWMSSTALANVRNGVHSTALPFGIHSNICRIPRGSLPEFESS